MNKGQLENSKIQVAGLLARGTDLLDTLNHANQSQDRTHQTLDNLSYVQGLKNKTDQLIKAKTNLNLNRLSHDYADFLNQASAYVDLSNVLTSSKSVRPSIKKKGWIRNFTNDLAIRMAKVDIENYIRDVKRANIKLTHELTKIERQLEEIEIHKKFEEMRESIQNIEVK